jgi:hypothetical protein
VIGNKTRPDRRDAQRATAAERMRRCRARRANGTIRVTFEVSSEGTAVLANLGWLDAADRQTPAVLKEAITRLVNAAAAAEFSPVADVRLPDR